MALDFPASFMLIASMNPCPCGYFNHPEKECSCPPGAVQKYNGIPPYRETQAYVEKVLNEYHRLKTKKPESR